MAKVKVSKLMAHESTTQRSCRVFHYSFLFPNFLYLFFFVIGARASRAGERNSIAMLLRDFRLNHLFRHYLASLFLFSFAWPRGDKEDKKKIFYFYVYLVDSNVSTLKIKSRHVNNQFFFFSFSFLS